MSRVIDAHSSGDHFGARWLPDTTVSVTRDPQSVQQNRRLMTEMSPRPSSDERDRAASKVPGPSDLPAPPVIELVRPADIFKPVLSPITIELRFASGSGPTIDMQSFRATYGWLGINITSRLLEHATKLPDSLVAENVDLPVGDHRVTVSIANAAGKTASKTFQFTIA